MTKTSLRKCLSFASGSLLLALTACGNSPGTAPTISDLALSAGTATAGQQVTLTLKFNVDDPDGDETGINVSLKSPGGQTQTFPETKLQGATDLMMAPIDFVVVLEPPTAGDYEISVAVVDEAGNVSNTLTTTLVVN